MSAAKSAFLPGAGSVTAMAPEAPGVAPHHRRHCNGGKERPESCPGKVPAPAVQ